MPITITMPALSPTMTEGTLAKWLVKEGDAIKSGMVIAEIETDKATMEFEAVDEGVLGSILVPAGTEHVAVNAPIAVLVQEGESVATAAAPAAPKPAPKAAAAPAPVAAAAAPAKPTASAAPPPGAGRVFVSPLARRMAEQAGLDLAAVAGSGPHGRIVKSDIEKALAGAAPAVARAPAAAPPPPAPAVIAPPPGAAYIEVPLNNVRKVIARRLSEAKQSIPHFYLTVDCQIDELLALRGKLNARADAYKLSVNDFIVRAVALALVKVPDCNAAWGGDKILRYTNVDVSVAVALDGGLITPIVRNADRKGLAQISNEMKDLAARAKVGKLKPEEFQGGGFSISNLGMYGIRDFIAVINPPQAGILAIGAGEQRPVVKDGALAVATMMTCTLSADHRVIDGALGAQFLAVFKGYVEEPLTMLL
jgi:pyruvate dehydrogenase E2 component (dihydrolipoamide acetyltransferase)